MTTTLDNMQTRDLLTVDEAAESLRVSRSMVYKLVSSRILPSVRVGPGTIRIERGELAEWIGERSSGGASPPLSCRHLGSKDNPLSVDHIVQRQHGGSDDPSNLRVLCLDCNKRRPQGNPPEPRPRFSRTTLTTSPHARPDEDDDPGWSIA